MSNTNAGNPSGPLAGRPDEQPTGRIIAVPKSRRRDGFSSQSQNKPVMSKDLFECGPTDNESEEAMNPKPKRSRAGPLAQLKGAFDSAVSSGSEAEPTPPRRPRLTRGPKPPTPGGPQANERRRMLNKGPQGWRGGPSLPQFVVPDVSFGSQTASVDPAPVDAMTGSNQGRTFAILSTRPQDGAIRTAGNGNSDKVDGITQNMSRLTLRHSSEGHSRNGGGV